MASVIIITCSKIYIQMLLHLNCYCSGVFWCLILLQCIYQPYICVYTWIHIHG